TGFLFGLEQDGLAYADRIMHLVQRPEEWQSMRRNARNRYEGTLTWDQYVSTLLRLLQEAGLVNMSR
ncbi:MAG TPA: hypothetical protein PLV70_14130, partial [Flavobacteriales bacterium]|nr:hypothetical protein [Flavobacteriales bacterium]